MNWIYFFRYNYLRSMSIDYRRQIIYFGNNVDERLEFGYFIYKKETFTRFFDFLPETNQVRSTVTDYTPCPEKRPPKQNAVKCLVYNTIQ